MTKLTLISLLIFQFAFVNAQQYQSIFGDSATSWKIMYDSGEGAFTDSIFTQEDSMVNNNLYKILRCSINCFTGFIREDTALGKVWFIPPTDTNEILIMDISLNLGDTFIINPWGGSTPDTAMVDSVYYFNGLKHIRLNYQFFLLASNIFDKLIFIEGVGPNVGVRNIIPDNYLLCAYKDGQKSFANYSINTCDILISGLNNMDFKKQNVIIIPQPISSVGSLKFENPNHEEFEFVLFDLLGNKIVNNVTNSSKFKINAYDIKPGLYFYRLSSNQKQRFSGKIVILKK